MWVKSGSCGRCVLVAELGESHVLGRLPDTGDLWARAHKVSESYRAGVGNLFFGQRPFRYLQHHLWAVRNFQLKN